MPATYQKDGDYYVSTRLWVMKKPGRQTKLTPEMRAQVLTSIRLGLDEKACLRRCGVSRQTFQRWLKTDESFREDVARAKRAAVDIAEVFRDLAEAFG